MYINLSAIVLSLYISAYIVYILDNEIIKNAYHIHQTLIHNYLLPTPLYKLLRESEIGELKINLSQYNSKILAQLSFKLQVHYTSNIKVKE